MFCPTLEFHNGQIEYSNISNSNAYASVATLTCNVEDITVVTTCQSDSTWSDEPPICNGKYTKKHIAIYGLIFLNLSLRWQILYSKISQLKYSFTFTKAVLLSYNIATFLVFISFENNLHLIFCYFTEYSCDCKLPAYY